MGYSMRRGLGGGGVTDADTLRNPCSGQLDLVKRVLEDYTLWWYSSEGRVAARRKGRGEGYF